jgi:hypothetical protein
MAAIIDQRMSIAKLKNIWKKIGIIIVTNKPLFPEVTVFSFLSNSALLFIYVGTSAVNV